MLRRSWLASICRLCPQPDLVERLISVDISPVTTAPVSEFSAYISAMKTVKIPEGLSRSAARQLADDQLRPVVQVGNDASGMGFPFPTCPWECPRALWPWSWWDALQTRPGQLEDIAGLQG